jgi:hypothetical protein
MGGRGRGIPTIRLSIPVLPITDGIRITEKVLRHVIPVDSNLAVGAPGAVAVIGAKDEVEAAWHGSIGCVVQEDPPLVRDDDDAPRLLVQRLEAREAQDLPMESIPGISAL